MTLIGYRSANHPQQVAKRGARPEIDDRATDPVEFAKLDARFGFSIDVCASAKNTKCERFYDVERNGLEKSWAGERVWCNPPYSAIEPWIHKAWSESPATGRGAELIVMLLPANRTEQGWWQRLVEPHRLGGRLYRAQQPYLHPDNRAGKVDVEFLPGRMRFIRADRDSIGPNERPPFGCCLLIWGTT